MMGGVPFRKGDHQDAQHVVVGMFVVGSLGQVGGDGAHESVTEQDAEEGADQGGCDFVADFFGRTSEGAHRDDYTENRGNDAEAGERVGHRAQGRDRLGCVVMLYVHIELEELIHVEWFDTA